MSHTAANYQWVEYQPPQRRIRLKSLIPLAVAGGVLCTIPFRESIDYGIKRLFYTPAELAEMRAVDVMFTHIHVFRVACPDPTIEQQAWLDYTAKQGWPTYPQAGAGCVSPTDQVYLDHINNFQVACPTIAFQPNEQARWARVAAQNHWAPYTQAGPACVDP